MFLLSFRLFSKMFAEDKVWVLQAAFARLHVHFTQTARDKYTFFFYSFLSFFLPPQHVVFICVLLKYQSNCWERFDDYWIFLNSGIGREKRFASKTTFLSAFISERYNLVHGCRYHFIYRLGLVQSLLHAISDCCSCLFCKFWILCEESFSWGL